MAMTTKDEAPEAVKRQAKVVVSKEVTEDEVQERYQRGENLYQIAQAVYGFQSEDAIERIRQILNLSYSPTTQLVEE